MSDEDERKLIEPFTSRQIFFQKFRGLFVIICLSCFKIFMMFQWFGMQVMWRKVLYNLAQWKILLKEEERGRMPTMLNQLELLARMLPLLSWPTPENKTRMTLEVCNLNGVRGLGPMLITAEDLARTLGAPHARDLWQAMAEVWDMPADACLRPTGKEWLLQLLTGIPVHQRATTLMNFWRIWHAHNEITHDKPCPAIEGSRRFLVSYLNSLMIIKQFPDAAIEKGKMVLDPGKGW
jgi:hypothetical protein